MGPRLVDMGLDRLKAIVLEMADLSHQSVDRAVELYMNGGKLSGEIFDDSERLRSLEESASDLATEIIARYQPVASDLRFIRSCMEISYGYFRFGRYAYDIAQVLRIFGDISMCDKSQVRRAGDQVKEMIKVSNLAFLNQDTTLARQLADMDDVVDEIYNRFVTDVIKDGNADLKCSLSATLILRYLERIADHAKYIGDSVLYTVNGEPTPRLEGMPARR